MRETGEEKLLMSYYKSATRGHQSQTLYPKASCSTALFVFQLSPPLFLQFTWIRFVWFIKAESPDRVNQRGIEEKQAGGGAKDKA